MNHKYENQIKSYGNIIEHALKLSSRTFNEVQYDVFVLKQFYFLNYSKKNTQYKQN